MYVESVVSDVMFGVLLLQREIILQCPFPQYSIPYIYVSLNPAFLTLISHFVMLAAGLPGISRVADSTRIFHFVMLAGISRVADSTLISHFVMLAAGGWPVDFGR